MMDEDVHNSGSLLRESNVGSSLEIDESQLSGANQSSQNMSNYQFQPNNRDQISYKVVQVSNNNPQPGLNILNASEFQNILSQQGSANTETPQIALVSGSNFADSGDNSATISSSNQLAAKVPLAYFSHPSARSLSSSDQESTQSDQNTNPSHFYLLMSPQDVISNSQSKQPTPIMRNQLGVSKFCERNAPTRRTQHNEVERRRRDRINTWIMKLSDIVPTCSSDHSKQGQSKGGILAKTCDYITELQETNKQFEDLNKEADRLRFEIKVANLQLKEKMQENEILQQTLKDHGLAVDIGSYQTS